MDGNLIYVHNKSDIDDIRQSFQKESQQIRAEIDAQVNYQMPLSPNIELANQEIKSDIDEGCDVSRSLSNKRLTRNDSCPSPLDETETVLMLGSGQKMRVQDNVANLNLNLYQN